ncbi:hypothetical protein I3F58_23025 [Streptomyces sp. MUM 203J]|uniref:hypothetical protein n=1 Tax=Streptomyces sp. MUM 203J TaxID=2791990 RepID=UPI001F03BD2D|nr:hypothetical protein [Streptomyces sp. MUM 203J]MCH0542372.1 hypothetical protein [Streptomyces sp. MUM 203J]
MRGMRGVRRTRGLVAGGLATALLGLAATACNGTDSGAAPEQVVSEAAAPTASVSATAAQSPSSPVPSASGASVSASPSPTPTEAAPPSATAKPTPKPVHDSPKPTPAETRTASPAPTKPPVPTRLSMAVRTAGGGLDLVRGGAAQEFTVTLTNGNTRAYTHLKPTFQIEYLQGIVLQRWDPATGTWKNVDLRVATDAYPPALHQGGSALALNAARTIRYRMRALAGGGAGSDSLMIYLIDTAADKQVAYHYLPHTTRQP